PQEGDFIVQLQSHIIDCRHLMEVFETRLAGDPTAVVLSDCRVAWDVPGLRPLGPDVAVFVGARPGGDRGTLDVAEEGARPVLVVEITSPETRKNDFGVKKVFYHQARVPLYIIADARTRRGRRCLKLIGLRWAPEGYEPLPTDEQGRLWLGPPLGLWLGIVGERL